MMSEGDGGGQGERRHLRIEGESINLVGVRPDENAINHSAAMVNNHHYDEARRRYVRRCEGLECLSEVCRG